MRLEPRDIALVVDEAADNLDLRVLVRIENRATWTMAAWVNHRREVTAAVRGFQCTISVTPPATVIAEYSGFDGLVPQADPFAAMRLEWWTPANGEEGPHGTVDLPVTAAQGTVSTDIEVPGVYVVTVTPLFAFAGESIATGVLQVMAENVTIAGAE